MQEESATRATPWLSTNFPDRAARSEQSTTRCPSEASDFGPRYPQEIGPEQDRRAAEIIPRALHVTEKTAEIEKLEAGDGQGDQNSLDYGAAITGKPEHSLR